MISLSGRSAVVTGASRGIGARLAESLARQGATVFLIARNEQRLKELAGKIKSSVPVSADVTDSASVDNARERITAELGGAPDILVNNAGIFNVASVAETDPNTFVETISTNLVGPFLFVRAFLSAMKERKTGHIVTIGSVADRTIFAGNAAYSAAKFGLRAIHEVMRAELRGSGVRATLISPAATDTGIWSSVTVSDAGTKPGVKRPMLSPDDVVSAVLFALTQPERVNVDELRLSHS
ncbi:MAG: SDR family oxidoreductase [Gemmatimonadaceae bacterium]